MPKPRRYTPQHAAAGLDAEFPEIETWPNQYPGYEIMIDDPEFTSVCPKTGLPDFGVITLRYQPNKLCLELKSYKEYLQSYRNLGIFQENVVNRVLEDVVRWPSPYGQKSKEIFVRVAEFLRPWWRAGRGIKGRVNGRRSTAFSRSQRDSTSESRARGTAAWLRWRDSTGDAHL